MKFIQPVSMVCTEEQYRAFLREPLLKMGYQEKDISNWDLNYTTLITNLDGTLGDLGNVSEELKLFYDRYFIETFNPKLFLAIAAMTDDEYGIPGEYWTFQGEVGIRSFTLGEVYKSLSSLDKPKAFIDNYGVHNGSYDKNATIFFRKSTLEELVEQLTVKNTKEEKNMAQESFKTTRQDLLKIWNVACSDWKPRIEQLVKEYGRAFSEEVELPFEKVKQMFKAANETQLEVLRLVFPTYSENRNAWVRDVSDDEMSEISNSIFKNSLSLQVATAAADNIGRPDLKGRALYVSFILDVKVHKVSSGGHVIEFIRK